MKETTIFFSNSKAKLNHLGLKDFELQTGNSAKEWKIDHMWYQRLTKYFCTSPKNVISIFGERLERDRKNFTKKGKSDLDQNICYIYLPDVHVLDFSTCYYELSFKNKYCCGYSQNLFATSNTNLRFRLDT